METILISDLRQKTKLATQRLQLGIDRLQAKKGSQALIALEHLYATKAILLELQKEIQRSSEVL